MKRNYILVLILINALESQTQVKQACKMSQYFNTITLLCQQCGSNQVSFMGTTCQCSPNFNTTQDQIGFIAGKGSAQVCLACQVYNFHKKNCTCATGLAKVKYNEDGSQKINPECFQCSGNSYVNDQLQCSPCPHFSMSYSSTSNTCVCGANYIASQGTCVSKADQTAMGTFSTNANYDIIQLSDFVVYIQLISENLGANLQIKSSIIDYYFLQAGVGCKLYQDQKSCQQLANLCLLTLDMSSQPCQLFQSIKSSQTFQLPNLFYQQSGNSIIKGTQLKMLVSFTNKPLPYVHQLQYFLIEYSMDGGVVGKVRLMQDELILCGNSVDDPNKMSQFGTNYQNNCVIDLSRYVSNYQTRFYQLYLQDIDGSLVDIPILVTNLLNSIFNISPLGKQTYINQGLDPNLYQFIYRFFIVDNLGPLMVNQATPQAIRFAYDTQFVLNINNNQNDKMYLPYVTISYKEVNVNTVVKGIMNVDAYFSVENSYDPSSFWQVASILFIIYHVIVGIIWITRLWIWSKCNPPYVAEQTYCFLLLARAMYLLIDTWAEGMFYFLFSLTGYWFCFFKFQQSIYVLMPSFSNFAVNYQPYEACFYTMFACKLVTAFNKIFNQGDLEVFFCDWEKTEILKPQALVEDLEQNVQKAIDKYKNKTSIWRTLLIANEFNELQTFRIVSVEWTLLWVAFFLVGLKWQNLAAEVPNLDLGYEQNHNYVLRYFIVTFVYLSIGLSQIIVRKIFDIWFPIAVEDFVDLCSIANISIMIVDDMLHGYYIHGENPIGYSEGSSEHLQHCLYYESLGKGKKRGFIQAKSNLNPGDEDLQTFEIYLSSRFKECYDKVFMLPLKSLTNDAITNDRYGNMSLFQDPTPKNLDMQAVELHRLQMLFYLKDVLTQIRNNHSQNIRTKLPIQKFLGYPPVDLELDTFRNQSLPIFYRDPGQSFKNIFFCGKEYFLLLTDICIFNFWLMITNNVFASILLTYLIINGMFSYRQWLGERNLADKSKIDRRFLI